MPPDVTADASLLHHCCPPMLLHITVLQSLPQAKEVEARTASLGKWKLDRLHKLIDVLDLQRGSGDKVGRHCPLAWGLARSAPVSRGSMRAQVSVADGCVVGRQPCA